MSDSARIKELRAAADAAYSSGDYAAAKRQADLILLYLGTTPDAMQGGESLQWRDVKGQILAFIARCDEQIRATSAASAGMVQRSKIVFRSAGDEY